MGFKHHGLEILKKQCDNNSTKGDRYYKWNIFIKLLQYSKSYLKVDCDVS